MKKLFPAAMLACLILSACGVTAQAPDSFACCNASDCTVAGDTLVTVSRGSMKCFSLGGEELLSRSLEPDDVLLAKAENGAAAYCVGGQTVAFSDGDVISTGKSIISVQLSDSGHAAVCTQEAGYMGLVTVYDALKAPVYRWYSAKSAVITAAVSPDGKMLAVLTENGVHLFSLSDEAERAMVECADMRSVLWLEDTVCAVSDKSIVSISDAGKKRAELENENAPKAWRTSGKTLAVLYADEAVILNSRLHVQSRIKPEGYVLGMDMRGDALIILTQDAVSLYDAGKIAFSRPVSGAGAALLLDDGGILAVGGGRAWIV